MRSLTSLVALVGASAVQIALSATIAAPAAAAHGCHSSLPPALRPHGGTGTPGSYRGPGDTGGRAGPAGPAGPATGSPGTPLPGVPLPGRPGPPQTPGALPGVPGTLAQPYTLGGQEIRDPASWQLWWEFNRDPYLRFGSVFSEQRTTGDDDFFLGVGQRVVPRPPGRVAPDTVRTRIIPTLRTVIRTGGDLGLLQETLVAAGKACRAEDPIGLPTSLRWFIEKNEYLEMNRTAAVTYGILGGSRGIWTLVRLANDGQSDPSLRAFAVYGLALLGAEAHNSEHRRAVVNGLTAVLEEPEAPDDLRAAAVLALGFVPLTPCGRAPASADGTLDPPDASLEAEAALLARIFMEKRESASVRAQAAAAMGRLLSQRPPGLPEGLRMEVVDLLVKTVDRNRRQPEVVRQGAILGLSMLGTADADPIDEWVRYALHRSFHTGGDLEKRFALIGLGLVGSRPGEGPDSMDATELSRGILLHHMTKGRRDLRPWAALALGVSGHWLLANGHAPDEGVNTALRTAVANCRKAEDLGAYALALGMRRDPRAVNVLLGKLDRVRDPDARGYIALALGLIGDRSAIEPLQEVLVGRKTPAHLRRDAGLGLGLLGDGTAVDSMLALLEEHDDAPTRAALARALGAVGDERSLDALEALFRDEEAEPAVRTSVAVALGFLADSRDLPWRALLATGTNYIACPFTVTNPQRTGVLDLH